MDKKLLERIKDSASPFLRTVYKIETARAPREFFECMDGCSVMGVSLDAWDVYTPYVSIDFYGQQETGFMHRLRHAWDVIRYGYPQHAEDVLLTLESARRMGILLLQESDKGEVIRKELEEDDET